MTGFPPRQFDENIDTSPEHRKKQKERQKLTNRIYDEITEQYDAKAILLERIEDALQEYVDIKEQKELKAKNQKDKINKLLDTRDELKEIKDAIIAVL